MAAQAPRVGSNRKIPIPCCCEDWIPRTYKDPYCANRRPANQPCLAPLMYRTVGIVYGHTVRHRDALRQDITAKAPCSRATKAALMIRECAGPCIEGSNGSLHAGPAGVGASTGRIRPALREHGPAPRGGALRASPGLCESAWSVPESTRRWRGPLDPEIQCRPPRCPPYAPRYRLQCL